MNTRLWLWIAGYLASLGPRNDAVRDFAARRGCKLLAGTALLLAFVSAAVAAPVCPAGEAKKHYWATSLSRAVDANIMQGLYAAVARGEIGWLDVDPRRPLARLAPGINLILYHVGGNCYIGPDCDRFPFSQPTDDRWGERERGIDLTDAATRKIVVNDLLAIVQRADKIAPADASIGVHVDNVHRLGAQDLAALFNEYLAAIAAAKNQGLISKGRNTGYIAKNNPRGFKRALDQKLLDSAPFYVISENATLREDGRLNGQSRIAQDIGRCYGIPVFLKTFGSDIAYRIEQQDPPGERGREVHVTREMAREMARLPHIAGVAWSVDEGRYHPVEFVQGAPVAPCGENCEAD
jgi:hypothetical protein